jgi:anti-sigma regulatory factor (Ser/Thr protein kinase)
LSVQYAMRARRGGQRWAGASQGFSPDVEARVALVATELATNLLKHAGEGLVAINESADSERSGIESLALEVTRYLVRQLLPRGVYAVREAKSGTDGLHSR